MDIKKAMKEQVADHGYLESRLVGAKPVEHGLEAFWPSGANYTLELEQTSPVVIGAMV